MLNENYQHRKINLIDIDIVLVLKVFASYVTITVYHNSTKLRTQKFNGVQSRKYFLSIYDNALNIGFDELTETLTLFAKSKYPEFDFKTLSNFLKGLMDEQSLIKEEFDRLDLSFDNELSSSYNLSVFENKKAVCYARRSINLNIGSGIETYEKQTLKLLSLAQQVFEEKEIYTLMIDELSGYYSPTLIKRLFKETSVQVVYIDRVDRLGRNVLALLDLLDYCLRNKKDIRTSEGSIIRGFGYIQSVIMGLFAEFELLSKQTKFSYYLIEVVKFELGLIAFDDMSDKAEKLFRLGRFSAKEDFLNKAYDFASKVVAEKDKTDKNGKRLHGEEILKSALEVIELLDNR